MTDIKELALRVGNEIAAEHNFTSRPKGGLTIELCTRFLAASEQQKNTRRSRLITYADETLNICDWEKRLGLSVGTLWHRVERGLTIEQAILAGGRQT